MDLNFNEAIKNILKDLDDVQTGSRNINVIGNHFEIGEIVFNSTCDHEPPDQSVADHVDVSTISHELSTVFINREDAEDFLNLVRDKDNDFIATIVSERARQKLFRKGAQSCDLYRILSKYRIYTASRQNWYKYVYWK